jgi:hypothetical protein
LEQEEDLQKVLYVQNRWMCLFDHDSEELPGESLHAGDQPLTT